MQGVITRSCQLVGGEEMVRPLVSLKVAQRQHGSSLPSVTQSEGKKQRTGELQLCGTFTQSLLGNSKWKNKLRKEVSACVRALHAKCVTFVSAWIQSCCVSCVSAPTISARSVCRYSSTVNTALPETQSSPLDITNTNTHTHTQRKNTQICVHLALWLTFRIKNRQFIVQQERHTEDQLAKLI